jgi:hypothetical protein
MRRLFAVTALVLAGGGLFACEGATGPQGPPGPPTDRSNLYCRYNPGNVNVATAAVSVTVTCDAKTDIPWDGTCESSEMPTGVYLSVDEPLAWEDINALPGWKCGWAAYGTPPDLSFGGTAGICCFKVKTP